MRVADVVGQGTSSSLVIVTLRRLFSRTSVSSPLTPG
jgi:hypothetical protein